MMEPKKDAKKGQEQLGDVFLLKNPMKEAKVIYPGLHSFTMCKRESDVNYLRNSKHVRVTSSLLKSVKGFHGMCEDLILNKNLTSLIVSGIRMGDTDVDALSNLIKVNTTITSLNLSRNQIGKGGAYALSQALEVNTTITSLNLSRNQIGKGGAYVLSRVLMVNTTITSLNLSRNQIGESGAYDLSEALKVNTTITSLNLSRNQIGESGAFVLSPALEVNTTITSLNLSRNQIGESGAFVLFRALEVNTTITSLNLSRNQIGDASAAALSEALKANKTITSLHLSGNQIGDVGAAALSEAMTVNTTITSVNLSFNQIGDVGSASLLKAVKANTIIISLDLSQNQIGDADAALLSEAIKANKILKVNPQFQISADPSSTTSPEKNLLPLHDQGEASTGKTDRSSYSSASDSNSDSEKSEDLPEDQIKILTKECYEIGPVPLYVQISGCQVPEKLFSLLTDECFLWSSAIRSTDMTCGISTNYFKLTVLFSSYYFHLYFGWQDCCIKVILTSLTSSVPEELRKKFTGEVRQFLETILEMLPLEDQDLENMKYIFSVGKRDQNARCVAHKVQGCTDNNCVQFERIGKGREAESTASGDWCLWNEDKEGIPSPVDLFCLARDVGPQWKSLSQALGFVKSELDLSDISEKSDKQRCFHMLMRWLRLSSSSTYQKLGMALMDERVQRDDLAVKHCTAEKSLSKWFHIGTGGEVIKYYGCTIDVPRGALESEVRVCVSFLKTGPPDGDCVTPIIHVESQPKDILFKRPVRVSLPVFISPLDLEDESMTPELTLMCFREGIWEEVEGSKLTPSQTSFEITHFSGWVKKVVKKGLWNNKRYCKDLVCFLFGKEAGRNRLVLRFCICCNTDSEIQKLKNGYREHGFTEKDVGGHTLTASRGYKVSVSSVVQTMDDVETLVKVKPERKVFECGDLDNLCRLVSYFGAYQDPPIPRGTVIVFTADNGDTRTIFKSQAELQIELDETPSPDLQTIEGETSSRHSPNGSTSFSANEEDCQIVANGTGQVTNQMTEDFDGPGSFALKKISLLLLCSEWGSSKGGLSTFNRQLAVHLARQPNLSVYCSLPKVSDDERMDAASNNVNLVSAKPVPGSSTPYQELQQLPPELLHPNIVIGHGRKFGSPAYLLRQQAPGCKWVHFVHVDCEEMAKYKDNDSAIGENDEKDRLEVDLCKEADLVVAVGPHLEEKYGTDLTRTEKKVHVFTPGLSEEFVILPQSEREKKSCRIYVFGRGASEDFELKGYDVAANALANPTCCTSWVHQKGKKMMFGHAF